MSTPMEYSEGLGYLTRCTLRSLYLPLHSPAPSDDLVRISPTFPPTRLTKICGIIPRAHPHTPPTNHLHSQPPSPRLSYMAHDSLPPALPFEPPSRSMPSNTPRTTRTAPDITNFTPLEVCKYLTDPSRMDHYIFRADRLNDNPRSNYTLLSYWTGTHFKTLSREESLDFFVTILKGLARKALDGDLPNCGELSSSGKRKATHLVNTTSPQRTAFRTYLDTAISLAKPALTPIERTAYIPSPTPSPDPYTCYADLSDLPPDLTLYSTVLPYLQQPLNTLTPKYIHTTREAVLQLQENLPAFFITSVPESVIIRSERELPNVIAAPFATYRIISAPVSETYRRYVTTPSPFIQSFLNSKGFNATVTKEHTQQERYTPHSLILTYNA